MSLVSSEIISDGYIEVFQMAEDYPSRELDQFLLRLPDGMRDRIAAAAKSNNRTMTAEIVSRLQVSLDADDVIVLKRKKPDHTSVIDENAVLERLDNFQKFLEDNFRGIRLALPQGTVRKIRKRKLAKP